MNAYHDQYSADSATVLKRFNDSRAGLLCVEDTLIREFKLRAVLRNDRFFIAPPHARNVLKQSKLHAQRLVIWSIGDFVLDLGKFSLKINLFTLRGQ